MSSGPTRRPGRDENRQIIETPKSRQSHQNLKNLACEIIFLFIPLGADGPSGRKFLFHLQKVLDSGMILRRRERGDYKITEKGYRALLGDR
jgi:predicted transcriptional regulator